MERFINGHWVMVENHEDIDQPTPAKITNAGENKGTLLNENEEIDLLPGDCRELTEVELRELGLEQPVEGAAKEA